MSNANFIRIGLLFASLSLFLFAGCIDDVVGNIELFICDGLEGNEADHCYQDAAIRMSNPEVCEDVQRAAPKSKCYLLVAEKTGDLETCEDITPGFATYDKQQCYQLIAIQTQNASICNMMGNYQHYGNDISPGGISKDICLEEVEAESGCNYDSECPAICEGNVKWKMGCDARTGECIKTFDYPCGDEVETIAGYDFPKTCSLGECVRNTAAISAKRQELSNNVKTWLAKKQEVTNIMYEANMNCISGLEDVTNKLIIDTAMKMASPPSSLLDIGSDATMGIVDSLASDPESIPIEEFISLNCNLYQALETDLELYDKKIENAQQEAEELETALNG